MYLLRLASPACWMRMLISRKSDCHSVELARRTNRSPKDKDGWIIIQIIYIHSSATPVNAKASLANNDEGDHKATRMWSRVGPESQVNLWRINQTYSPTTLCLSMALRYRNGFEKCVCIKEKGMRRIPPKYSEESPVGLRKNRSIQ